MTSVRITHRRHQPRTAGSAGGVPQSQRLAEGLGYFSLGLGAAQVAAPRLVAWLTGVRPSRAHKSVMRAMGIRELAVGTGLMSASTTSPWLWARAAGDVLDLAMLAPGLASSQVGRRRRVLAIAAVAGFTACDVVAGRQIAAAEGKSGDSSTRTHLRAFTTIRCEPEEAYRYWRNFENFPNFMDHVESVQVTGETLSHWRVKGPAGSRLEWDAEIIRDDPSSLISWQALPGAAISNQGGVRFREAPGGQGTEVSLDIVYSQPAGMAGGLAARLLGEHPQQQVSEDLRRFKLLIEASSLTSSDGTPAGAPAGQQPSPPLPGPAQPAE
jgi:uncharacterized membrane protein